MSTRVLILELKDDFAFKVSLYLNISLFKNYISSRTITKYEI